LTTIRILAYHNCSEGVGILFLVRHGQSTANRDRILQGQLDTQLTSEGEEQAASIRDSLPHEVDLVYSSNLIRARRTAEIVYSKREIITDPRINEMNLGILEGRQRDQLSQQEEFMWKQLRYDATFSEHQGETGDEFINRVDSFFSDITQTMQEKGQSKIVVFTHFGVIQAIVGQILKQDQVSMPNVGILKLVHHLDNWRLDLLQHEGKEF
jgi:broad specificity phosphatase PhoE